MKWIKNNWQWVLGYVTVGALAYYIGYLIYKSHKLMNGIEYTPDDNFYNTETQKEGDYLQAYYDGETPDSPNFHYGGVGTLTIGRGHTGPVDGQPITEGMTITEDQSKQLQQDDVAPLLAWLRQRVTGEHTRGQWDSMLDFLMNASGGKNSSVWDIINNGTNAQVADFFKNHYLGEYQNGILVQLPGLVKRAQWRADQWT
jgi:GH24 family phage-related lysozyme (muramidase)